MDKFIQKHQGMITWLSGLGLPISILLAGWLITTSIESSKLDSEHVKIALGILSAQNKDKDGKVQAITPEESALRLWAVRLLNRKSPEKFTKEEQDALASGKQRLGISWVSPVGPLSMSLGSELKAGDPEFRIRGLQFQIGTPF